MRTFALASIAFSIQAQAAVTDVVADWNARIANAIHGQNFSGFSTTAEVRSWETMSNPTRLTLESEHALSGKTLRVHTFPEDGAVSHGFQSTLDGVRTSVRPPTLYKRLYVQIVLWGDDFFNWPFKSNATNAPKLFILDRSPQYAGSMHSPSANPGEVVIDNQFTYGFIHSYRRLTDSGNNFQGFERSRPSTVNNFNFSWHPSVDNGGPTANQNDYERRYGPYWQGMSGTNQAAGTRLTTQFPGGFPDPDAAAGSIAWNRGGYTVLEVFVDYDADRAQIWAAHYGNPPKLIIDSRDDDLDAAHFNKRSDIQGWDGYHLTTFRTQGIAEPGVRPAMFVDYVEVITSTNPIPFPGHLSTPLPGTGGLAPKPPTNVSAQ